MPDLHGQLTPQGNLNGTLNTIVYASNYNVLENKPSINSVTLQGNKTASELGLATPEDITVTSVNGETGAVVLDGSDINYDADTTLNNKIDDLQSQISSSGVLAVNGKTGVVILTGADINYSAGVTLNSKIDAVESEIPTVNYPVTSVNGETGAVVLDGSDIAYDTNNTVNEKIAAVESEIPTVDYPVTSVNEKTGDVELTGGDIPLGSDFSDPTSTAGSIGDLSTLTTTDKSSIVGAVNEVNAVTTGTVSTTNTHITILRSTLVKYGKVKILSVIFQWDGTGSITFDLSSGFGATYNVDFIGGDDAGKSSRYRISAGYAQVNCFSNPTVNSYTTFTISYI